MESRQLRATATLVSARAVVGNGCPGARHSTKSLVFGQHAHELANHFDTRVFVQLPALVRRIQRLQPDLTVRPAFFRPDLLAGVPFDGEAVLARLAVVHYQHPLALARPGNITASTKHAETIG